MIDNAPQYYPDVKQNLSPSSIASWLNNRSQFIYNYFEGKRSYSPAMALGTKIHKDIEQGLVPVQKFYQHFEHAIKLSFDYNGDEVSIYGIMDGVTEDYSEFVDYKTGKKWEQHQVDEDIKQTIYAYMIFRNTDLQEVTGHIEWVELLDGEPTGVTEVLSVVYNRDDVVEYWDNKIHSIIGDINKAYEQYLKNNNASDEVKDLAYRLSKIKEKQGNLKEQEAWLRTEIFRVMDSEEVTHVKTPYLSAGYQDKKVYSYPEEFVARANALKEEEKALQKTLEAEGKFVINKIKVIR